MTTSSTAGPARQDARWLHRFPVAVVLLLALAAYASSFHGAFVFDDVQHVRDNPRIRDLGALLSWDGYLPLRHRYVGYLTFALNYAAGKLDVGDYHLVNFCIHAANAALVYALVVLCFRTPRVRGSALAGSAQAVAFAAAALFATHPLQTQAVTYVVQRFTSLATLFYLLAVVLFLSWRLHREAGDAGAARRRLLYGGVLVAALLGMKTKEIVFTLPLAIVVCELTFFEPLPWRRRLFLAPIAATMVVVPVSYLLARGAGGSVATAVVVAGDTAPRAVVSWSEYLLSQPAVVVTYLRLLAWPAGQSLDHDVPIAHGLLELRVLVPVCLLAALAAAAALLVRRTSRAELDPAARLVAFGIAWFFLALALESSVVPIADVMVEHRVYLPSAGAFAAAATGAALLLRRVDARRGAAALVVLATLLSAVLGVATFRRNRVWASEVSVWADAAAKAPAKSRPHVNVGAALAMAGRHDEGIRELRRGIELDPASAYARAQLGAALLALGRLADAEPELREAVRVKADDPEAIFNLAVVLLATGRRDEAVPLFRRFLDLAPPSYASARRFAEARLSP